MIELKNYSVRLLETQDSEAIFHLIESNRPRLLKYLPTTCKENGSLQLSREYVENRKLDADNRIVFTCLIEHRPSSKLAGMFIIKKLDWHASSCEFGYFICKDFEGQGITSLVIEAAAQHCFKKLRLLSIDIVTGPDNSGSIRVAEKNGFVKKQVLVGGHKDQNGTPIDVFRFQLTRD